MDGEMAGMVPADQDPIFFRLPQAWFSWLLSEWLDIKSVATLDTAMTNHQHRSHFLQFLRDMKSKYLEANTNYCHGRNLVYLSRRQIHVKEINYRVSGRTLCSDTISNLCFPSLEIFSSIDIDNAGVLAIVRNSPGLKSISVSEGSPFHLRSDREMLLTEAALHAIAQHCPLLERMSIGRNCKRPFTTTDTLINLFRSCPELKSFGLEHDALHRFDDSDLAQLQEFSPPFTHFDFIFGPRVTTNAIADFAASCTKLKFFRLQKWNRCDKVLAKVAESCHALETLQFWNSFSQSQGRASDALRALARNCPSLKTIELYHCEYLNDTTLELLGKIASLEELLIQVNDPFSYSSLMSNL